MDVDPLSDRTPPPRHALESDSEDEDVGGDGVYSGGDERVKDKDKDNRGDVRIESVHADTYLDGVGGLLVVFMARLGVGVGVGVGEGVKEGEAKLVGRVYVHDEEVGKIHTFTPTTQRTKSNSTSKTRTTLLTCKASKKLSIYTYRPFASLVLGKIKPSRTIIIDTYASTSYVSTRERGANAQPMHPTPSPIRYLSTHPTPTSFTTSAGFSPYEPPNMIESTSAGMMSVLQMDGIGRHGDTNECSGLCVLLPTDDSNAHILEGVRRVLSACGVEGVGNLLWAQDDNNNKNRGLYGLGRATVGEGGMYI